MYTHRSVGMIACRKTTMIMMIRKIIIKKGMSSSSTKELIVDGQVAAMTFRFGFREKDRLLYALLFGQITIRQLRLIINIQTDQTSWFICLESIIWTSYYDLTGSNVGDGNNGM